LQTGFGIYSFPRLNDFSEGGFLIVKRFMIVALYGLLAHFGK